MRARTIAAAALFSLIAGAAEAAPIIFTAADPGAGPGMPFPNSAAEAAAFDAGASGTRTLVTFEAAPVGSFTNLTIAPGVTINGTDFSGNPQQILNMPSPSCGGPGILCGFNTTPAGSEYVQLFGGSLTYSFGAPIDAFGAFLTGVNLAGETIRFNDGSSETLTIPNSGGGVEFFGFTDAGRQISSITARVDVGSFADIIGMDDVRFFTAATAVPEPTSLAVLGIGLVGLGLCRRRCAKPRPAARRSMWPAICGMMDGAAATRCSW